MEMFNKLQREVQVILVAGVLFVIFSFLDWQQVSGDLGTIHVSYGINMWHGVGVVTGLLLFAVLLWELARMFVGHIELGPVTPGLMSVGLALLLLLFTVITFLTHNEARHWPSWLGLILSIVIAAAAVTRARAEGVEMPDLSALQAKAAASSSGGGASASSTPPAAPSAPSEGEQPPTGAGGAAPEA